MRAARLYEYGGDLQIDEVAAPEAGNGGVVVRVGGSGVCHSDLHFLSGEREFGGLPHTPGHENAGWVEQVGPGVEGFEPGDPVAVFGGWGCGQCRFCLGGDEQICNVMRWGGVGPPGGYADYLAVPGARHLVHLRDLDPVTAAPLTDAALTPYRAVKKTLPRLVPGTTAVVIGVGGLGHFGLQLVKTLTPARVIAVDTAADKRALAADLGADRVFDPGQVDVPSGIVQATGGDGATAVFDFVGADATLPDALGSVARQGIVVLVGLAGGQARFSTDVATEAVVTTSHWGNHNELEEVLDLARADRIQAHTAQYPLDQINQVFQQLANGNITGRAVIVPDMDE